MSCKAGFLLTISLFCQQEVIGFCFSSEKQEPYIDQYFLKENVAWQSQVFVGLFLKWPKKSHTNVSKVFAFNLQTRTGLISEKPN